MLALELDKDYLTNEDFSAGVGVVTYIDTEKGHSCTRPGTLLTWENKHGGSRNLEWTGQGVALVNVSRDPRLPKSGGL